MSKVQELVPHVVKDTGITLMIRKVSPLLGAELQRAFPRPQPPLQEVDYGDGKKVMEPNPANPDYAKAVATYESDLEIKLQSLLIKRGVVIELGEEEKAAVKELRAFWKTEFSKELDKDDKTVYVSFIALGTREDTEELINAIMRRSQPTEAATAEVKANFPG